MDVSPRALRAVTFREKLRGYHPEDVDKFLERVAEGVAGLQTKLEEALARAEKAEKDRAEATVSEESVQRTLTLAQRTADMALREAKDAAARIGRPARDDADRIAEAARNCCVRTWSGSRRPGSTCMTTCGPCSSTSTRSALGSARTR